MMGIQRCLTKYSVFRIFGSGKKTHYIDLTKIPGGIFLGDTLFLDKNEY